MKVILLMLHYIKTQTLTASEDFLEHIARAFYMSHGRIRRLLFRAI